MRTKVELVNSQPAALMEKYYYPCDQVINFEKTLIKYSIVWDYARERREKDGALPNP